MQQVVDVPFVGPAYESASKTISAQESLNVYSEINAANSKQRAFIQRPGRQTFCSLTGEPRAMWYMDGTLYAVSGTMAYRIDMSGAAIELGAISGSGRLGVAHNGETALVCSDTLSWAVTASGVTLVSDPDMPSGRRVTYQNGYFLKSVKGSNRFGASAIDDPLTWETLDFAQERQLPGDVVQILTDHAELLLMKSDSIGFWFESGAATGLPFDRVPQLTLNTGVVAPDSVVGSLDERVFFLGQQINTSPMAFVLTGRNAQKISTPAMDVQFNKYTNPQDAYAWSFSTEGHFFYALTFPGQATWVYDVSTNEWHQWARSQSPDYDATYCVRAYNKTFILAYGGVFSLENEVNRDGQAAIIRRRATSPVEVQGRPFSVDWVELDCEVGTAATGTTPEVGLEVSRDRGFTWSNARYAGLGTEGQYRRQVRWTGLGSGREMVFRVTSGADAKVIWTSLRAGVRVGRN